MKRFTDSIRSALRERNWYAALALALAMPDICGNIDQPNAGSGARYADWFDVWMGHHYRRRGPDNWPEHARNHTFMTGSDCYALRCSFLHAGEGDVAGKAQLVRDALDKFRFIAPPLQRHCNQSGRALELQVDIFCAQMADQVDAWESTKQGDAGYEAAKLNLLVIYGPGTPGVESF